MKFIINNMVEYNSLDGSLLSLDSNIDMITLGWVANELLFLFVKNNGVALYREDILSELWEKKGLSASSNNLNNHVSMLRKSLLQLGLSDLITTIPKYGFVFKAEIKVHSVDENSSLPLTNNSISKSEISSTILHMRVNKIKILIMLLILILTIAILIIFSYHDAKLQRSNMNVVSVGECHIHTVGDKVKYMEYKDVVRVTKLILEERKLKCKSTDNVYFIADERIDSSGDKFIAYLLAMCSRENNSACSNYYSHDYRD
ncbi:Transcriptional regulatory protein, C terminal [Serratia quinivorans]|nr:MULTISPECIES: winged helix-turn-helix domain-containing protein [Serratia]CAI1035765.1 Transcriptional regulatory protein, C terminal [Serratia quinivorans]CAI1144383.1 Transcriptional regulatory protein, C terminal [Serratia quinivorans]CAI1795854.1 Transcriptional regulatory protein, C terminal [Serratia quinivorans]CAI1941504.1 Transcriptional regulatory protein, C terminal [Serratia liquefaciens]CAI1959334.1 Transcriptional regulatory protein, C terminal [Serratia quinivorans]